MAVKYWDTVAQGLDLTPISERQLRERLKKILHFPAKPAAFIFQLFSELDQGQGDQRRYGTAWSWLQKLRRCAIVTDREKLNGRVEVDEFFIGGKKSGKRGRGSDGKTIVAVAVER